MKQQINLYQPLFRKQRKIFSATTLLQACGLVGLGMMMIYGYGVWQKANLEKDLAQLTGQLTTNSKLIAQVGQQFPAKTKDPLLEQEIARLQTERDSKQQMLAITSGGAFGTAGGFSHYFEGLARQRLEGLWLTGISITDGTEDLRIFGSALSAELIPVFLGQLSKEPVFSGTEFKTLLVERPEADTARIDFVLGTREVKSAQEDQDGAPAAPRVSPQEISKIVTSGISALGQE